jgi:carnitine-CoA ligase
MKQHGGGIERGGRGMGHAEDKFEAAARRWETWRMQDYSLYERVIPQIIADKARRRPDHIAFSFGDESVTLGELDERINRTANGLLRLGIGRGDKVAIMMGNRAEFLYAWFGLNKIGAVEVPINVDLRGAGLAYQIEQSDSVALIVEVERSNWVLDIIDSLGKVRHFIWVARGSTQEKLPLLSPGNQLWMTELQAESSDPPDVRVRYNELATILYTSGTTGRSKGVMMSHHYWYDIWAQSVQYARYTDKDVLYTGLPLFHGNAQGITVGSSLLADARAVIVPRFSASRFWADCRRWNCTEANYIGGIIPILLKQDPSPDDADNPVRLMVGAAAPAHEWLSFQQRFNTKLLEVYGMTECYCCLASPYDSPRAGSCGQAITGWDVRVVNEDDTECPPSVVGEIIARSNRMWVGTSGYYGNPEATIELMRNGWIHTGDLGSKDADGYFYFVDRLKQALRRRGENISSFEVEAVIGSHPAVLEACVVGVPSDVGEEEVKAVIVLRPGNTVSPEDLVRFCESRLAYFAIPRYVAIRESLPKTPSERVEKYRLKEEGVTADCWDRERAGIKLRR